MNDNEHERLRADRLERLYRQWNRREHVAPDPLQLIYAYEDPVEREIAALLASCLAYGRVAHIVRSVSHALARLPHPARFLASASDRLLRRAFRGFRHRFTGGGEIAALLLGARDVRECYGSLGACLAAGLRSSDDTIAPALSAFVREVTRRHPTVRRFLLPDPAEGSACKRLNLYLRWMVRRDAVDPGGWDGVPASRLIVPLDTHMHRIALALGLTRRRQANLRTALEVTACRPGGPGAV